MFRTISESKQDLHTGKKKSQILILMPNQRTRASRRRRGLPPNLTYFSKRSDGDNAYMCRRITHSIASQLWGKQIIVQYECPTDLWPMSWTDSILCTCRCNWECRKFAMYGEYGACHGPDEGWRLPFDKNAFLFNWFIDDARHLRHLERVVTCFYERRRAGSIQSCKDFVPERVRTAMENVILYEVVAHTDH